MKQSKNTPTLVAVIILGIKPATRKKLAVKTKPVEKAPEAKAAEPVNKIHEVTAAEHVEKVKPATHEAAVHGIAANHEHNVGTTKAIPTKSESLHKSNLFTKSSI